MAGEERLRGKIRNWFGDKGLGFIIPESEGPDYFCHHSIVKVEENKFVSLAPGLEVEFSIDPGEKRGTRQRALDVTAPGGGPLKTLPKPPQQRSRSRRARRSRSRGRRDDSRGPPRQQRGPARRDDSRPPPRREERPPARRDDSRPPLRREGGPRREPSPRREDNGSRYDRDRPGPGGGRDDSRARGGDGGVGPSRQRDASRSQELPRRRDISPRGGAREDSMPPLERPLDRRRRQQRAQDEDGVVGDGARRPVVSRSASPAQRNDAAIRSARAALADLEDDVEKAKEAEVSARKAWKRIKATIEDEVEQQEREEDEKLTSDTENKKNSIQRSLQHTLDETEQRFKDELEQRITDLKAEFAAKHKEEKIRVQEDSERMESDEVAEMKEKHAKRIKTLRDDAEQDKELVEQRAKLKAAADRVTDIEDDLDRATKKVESLNGRAPRSARDRDD